MKNAPSLTNRLTLTLVTVQWAAFMTALVFIICANSNGMLSRSTGAGLTSEYIAEAVERGRDGSLHLTTNDCLTAFLQRHPDVWYVATDGEHTLSRSDTGFSSPADGASLVAAVETFRRLTVNDASSIEVLGSGADQILVVTGGTPVTWADAGIIASVALRRLVLPLTFPLITGAAIVLLFVARRLLGSVRRAARAAAEIVPNALGQRLPTEGIPREILPLVQAVNTALARLDDGYERYRRFVADAAHELRTPVAVLHARLDGLPDGVLKEELSRDSRRIANIATRLLEMERVQQAAFAEEIVDLSALVRAVAADMAPLAIERGYDLEVDAPDIGPSVRADFTALRGAITNLVSNAIVHAGGHGLIRIAVKGNGEIEVNDNGPGIPAEEAEMVFAAFHRIGKGGNGAGLGLAIVRETMHVHNGSAELVNPGGPGATFRLSFPIDRMAKCGPANSG